MINKDFIAQEVKDFLYLFPYNVMFESNTQNEDVFFVVIDRKDCKTTILKNFFALYEEEYGLENLSKPTMNYIKNSQDKFFFVFVDKVNRTDPFYQEKTENIKKNANNIIAIRAIGEAADSLEHWNYEVEKKLKQTKRVSTEVFKLLQEEAGNKLNDVKPKIAAKIKKLIR